MKKNNTFDHKNCKQHFDNDFTQSDEQFLLFMKNNLLNNLEINNKELSIWEERLLNLNTFYFEERDILLSIDELLIEIECIEFDLKKINKYLEKYEQSNS